MRCDAMQFARKVLWRQGTDECACATSVLELAPRVAKSATLSKMARVAADESAQRCPKRGEGRGGGQRCGDIARKMVYNWRQTLVDHRGDAVATEAPPEPPSRERERETPLCFVLMAEKRSFEIDHEDVVDDSLWPAEPTSACQIGVEAALRQ